MKKRYFGASLLALSVVALSQLKVSAAPEYVVNEDFKYVEGETLSTGGTSNHNVYSITSLTGYSASIENVEGTDGTLHIHADAGALASTAPTVGIRDNGGSSTMFNKENESLLIKTRFKFDQTYSKAIRLYFNKTEVNANAKTYKLLDMKGNKIYYNLGAGSDISVDYDVTKNVWHDVAFVIENNGDLNDDNTSPDKIYAYIDGNLAYQANFNAGDNFIGKLHEINFLYNKGNFSADSNWDIDYIYTAVYNKAAASVENKEVTSGDMFELNPSIKPTKAEYDPSITNYTVTVDNPEALSYDAATNKFTALAVDEDTTVNVTYDFVDPNVKDVTSVVTVKKAVSEILPSEIAFDHDSYDLAIGQKLNLDEVVKVLPESASNKNVTYTLTGDAVSLEGSVVTAKKNGEAKVTVKTEAGDVTKELKILVSGNNLAAPSSGTSLSEDKLDASGYGVQGNSARPVSPISVVEDDKFGTAFKIEGTGTNGASAIIKYVEAKDLTANKDYKLTGYVKGNNLSGIKLDVKVYGYWFDTETNDYGFAQEACYQTVLSVSATKNDEWYYFETSPINLDTNRMGQALEGFKIQLWSWNNQEGKDVYYSNIAFKELDTVTTVGFNATVNGEKANDTYDVRVEDEINLGVVAVPSAGSVTATYQSSDETIATVAENGVVTVLKEGAVEVTVTSFNGQKKVIKLNVAKKLVNATAITMDQDTYEVYLGTTVNAYTINVEPANTTSTVLFTVSDSDVVSVDVVGNQLYIVPHKAGSAQVTLYSSDDENVKYVFTVNVMEEQEGSSSTEDNQGESSSSLPVESSKPEESSPESSAETVSAEGNNAGLIIGIVAAAVVVCGAVVAFFVLKKKKK